MCAVEWLLLLFMKLVKVFLHRLRQVCMHIARCYGVAAQFEGCRERIQETSTIVKDLCRILYYKVGKYYCL